MKYLMLTIFCRLDVHTSLSEGIKENNIMEIIYSSALAFSLFLEFGDLPLEVEGSMQCLVEPYLSLIYSDYDKWSEK